jgi:hypothetical protein
LLSEYICRQNRLLAAFVYSHYHAFLPDQRTEYNLDRIVFFEAFRYINTEIVPAYFT